MKNIIYIAILLTLIGNTHSFASENYSISVGVLSWYNNYNPISRIKGLDVPNTTFAFMTGPTLRVQYKDMFLDVTYLLSNSDYHIITPGTLVSVHRADANSDATRKDVNVIVGYKLNPTWSVNTGFEGIYVDDNVSLTSGINIAHGRRIENYNIGMVGVGADIPLGHSLIWITNGNILLGAFHNDVAYPKPYKSLNEPNYDDVAWGGNIDSKIVYSLLKHLSVDFGLKLQYIKSGTDNSSFVGPSLRLDYKF